MAPFAALRWAALGALAACLVQEVQSTDTVTTTTTTLSTTTEGPGHDVAFSLILQNVDYNQLTANSTLTALLETAVKEAVASAAGSHVAPERVTLQLSQGSVIVHVTINPPDHVWAGTILLEMSTPAELVHAVFTSVERVSGLGAVTMGTLGVRLASLPRTAQVGVTRTSTTTTTMTTTVSTTSMPPVAWDGPGIIPEVIENSDTGVLILAIAGLTLVVVSVGICLGCAWFKWMRRYHSPTLDKIIYGTKGEFRSNFSVDEGAANGSFRRGDSIISETDTGAIVLPKGRSFCTSLASMGSMGPALPTDLSGDVKIDATPKSNAFSVLEEPDLENSSEAGSYPEIHVYEIHV